MKTFLKNHKMSFLLPSFSFLFLFSCLLNTFASPTQHLCHSDQSEALLEFTTEFGIYNSTQFGFGISCNPKTESWENNSDCCSWDGITCDANSGKVIGLDLYSSCLHGRLEFNSSLFRLRHLRDLNLAHNNFTYSPIPAEFDQLKELEKLTLSESSFVGKIPTKLFQLTKLVSLDLSSNSLSIGESFLPLLVRNLRNLRVLDMSYVNISSEIPNELSSMWSLRSICLVKCNLLGEFPSSVFLIPNLQSIILDDNRSLRGSLPVFHGNNSMKILSLSDTSFSGTIPDSINNLKHLTSLDLGFSLFSGRIPSSLGNLSYLSSLYLFNNDFSGEISASIGNLKQLRYFFVSSNKLSGDFPSALLNLTELRFIYLGDNEFTGLLPPNISHLPLVVFSVTRNSFTGVVPSSLFMIASLTLIQLGDNQFSGLVGIENISQLLDLQQLSLGDNKFMGSPVDLNIFSPLKKLEDLILSSLPLMASNITYDLDFSSQLGGLDLSGCNLTKFPEFIRNQRNLGTLSLSNNKIKGQVPYWLWRLPNLVYVDLSNNAFSGFKGSLMALPDSKISTLDLSSNSFQGTLLIPPRFIQFFFASKNNFTGEIPRSICRLASPIALDLSDNNLHGSIPCCLKNLMNSLSDLNLQNNSFSGSLPDIFINAKILSSLDVSHNQLEGILPPSLTGCSALQVLNVGNNKINGMFPFKLNSLEKLQVLVLRSNKFHGTLQSIFLDGNQNLRGSLPVFHGNNSMKILSLSGTSFSGTIPDSINNLKYLTSLDLQFSLFSGKIPSSIGNLSYLSLFSLSDSDFFGEIPSSIGNLKQLRYFSVSSNKLSGDVPSVLLNLTQLRSIDLSYNHFTGLLPPNISHLPLEHFDVGRNSFTGVVPSSLFMIPSLTLIQLDHNQFSGLAGIENVSQLLDLQYLSLKENKFMGSPVDLNIFSPLKKLEYLYLSSLPLMASNITYDLDFSSQLLDLDLSGCNLTEFPEFIRNHRNLSMLDLSNNKIEGQVPYWLWRLPKLERVDLSNNSFNGFKGSLMALPDSMISTLDLSSNAFQGTLIMPPRFIQFFFASKNNFTGEIPRSICRLASPIALDLSDNNLHGSIPCCLKNLMNSLSDLNLQNNSFSGSLPDIFINAKNLSSLDISHNRLEGNLPPSLTGCSTLEVLNVGSNKINGIFPFKLNLLENLKVLILSSNKFHGTLHNDDGGWFGFPQLNIIDVSHNDFVGTLPNDYFLNWTAISSTRDNSTKLEYISGGKMYYTLELNIKGVSLKMERVLKTYTTIDFSGNRLQGKIPDSIGLLKGLRILNLSRNAFTNHIPSSLANLTVLESLDISQNNISGEILPELGTLFSLAWINVSHNQLVGSIPQGTQFQRQNCSSYEGNLGLSLQVLCGDNLTKSHSFEAPMSDEKEEEGESISWKAAGLGFVPGVVFGLAVGYKLMKTFGRKKK